MTTAKEAGGMEDGWLLPDPEGEDGAPFWAGAARHELLVQACDDCGTRRFPPRPMCPRCRSLATRWDAMSGRATIWSYVVPHPPLLPAYSRFAPYNVIVVVLDDDPTIRMVGNLVASPDGAINDIDPATIEIGEPVRVVYQEVGGQEVGGQEVGGQEVGGQEVGGVTIPRWVRA